MGPTRSRGYAPEPSDAAPPDQESVPSAERGESAVQAADGTASATTAVVAVAVAVPLRRLFDYRCPQPAPSPGCRVLVPFGSTRRIGVVIGARSPNESDAGEHVLRDVVKVVDEVPAVDRERLQLAQWAWRYYHAPPGEVVAALLPAMLRAGRFPLTGDEGAPLRVRRGDQPAWWLAAGEPGEVACVLANAPRQWALWELLHAAGSGLDDGSLGVACRRRGWSSWRQTLRTLCAKGLVEPRAPAPQPAPSVAPPLNPEQRHAVSRVVEALGAFRVLLLDGVTGSGKTEVYLAASQMALRLGRQVLVLVPEIGLTPQLIARFQHRLGVAIAVMHSGLTEAQRLASWDQARLGEARVILGTRSAVFAPLLNPGLVVVDEEHDTSLKQHEGFRYHARDVAIKRAQGLGVPVLLGSATPSLESLHNCERGHYERLRLTRRAGRAHPPRQVIVDLRGQPLLDGLSPQLLAAAEASLERGEQALLFVNRRGYAPILLCHHCGWMQACDQCSAYLSLHLSPPRLWCHHCGHSRPVPAACPSCGCADLIAVGTGTERLERALQRRFPQFPLVRLDRDSTRRRGALESALNEIRSGQARLLVGTQMLAKGHDFPDVTCVGVLDVDRGLFGSDFRALEQLAQLITQVSGRAGRAEKPGLVLLQTHHPHHPLLSTLVGAGYEAFATAALAERAAARLPPFTALALLRGEGEDAQRLDAFFQRACEHLRHCMAAVGESDIELFGPAPAPMARRMGRHRRQLAVHGRDRLGLQRVLRPWVEALDRERVGRGLRWNLDVDPVDMH